MHYDYIASQKWIELIILKHNLVQIIILYVNQNSDVGISITYYYFLKLYNNKFVELWKTVFVNMTSRFVENYIWFLKIKLKKNIVNFKNLSTIKEILSKPYKLLHDSKLKIGIFVIVKDVCYNLIKERLN